MKQMKKRKSRLETNALTKIVCAEMKKCDVFGISTYSVASTKLNSLGYVLSRHQV